MEQCRRGQLPKACTESTIPTLQIVQQYLELGTHSSILLGVSNGPLRTNKYSSQHTLDKQATTQGALPSHWV